MVKRAAALSLCLLQLWLISPAQAWAQLRVQKVSGTAATFAYTGNGVSPSQSQTAGNQLKIQASPGFILDLKLPAPKAAAKAYGRPVPVFAYQSAPADAAVPSAAKPADMAAALAVAYQQASPILDELSPEKARNKSSEDLSGSANKLMDKLLGQRSQEDSGSVRALAPAEAKPFLKSENAISGQRFASPPPPAKPGRLQRFLVAAPLLTFALILLNSAAFAAQAIAPEHLFDWGIIPARVMAAFRGLQPLAMARESFTFISAMFLHVGVGHIANNMLALLIIGPNIEANLGWKKAAVLYLLAGLCGDILSLSLYPAGHRTSLGASGAIAGLAGAALICNLRYMSIAGIKELLAKANGPMQDYLKACLRLGMGAVSFLMGVQICADIPKAIQQYLGLYHSDIGYDAHAGGLLSGILLFLLLRAKRRIRSNAK